MTPGRAWLTRFRTKDKLIGKEFAHRTCRRGAPTLLDQANLTRFIQEVNGRWKADCSDHASLFAWSIREPEKFWQSVWSFAGVVGDMGAGPYLVDADKMPGARWFPNVAVGARGDRAG